MIELAMSSIPVVDRSDRAAHELGLLPRVMV